MKRSWSQAGQDVFVHNLLVKGMGIQKGTFIDVGCSQPYIDNNSYHLEELGWRGLLMDIYDVASDPNHKIGEKRSSPFVCADATKVDWYEIVNRYNIKIPVDYVSFDIDTGTVKGVQNFPWKFVKPKVVTIEHDFYQNGWEPKIVVEKTLFEAGYTLVCEDVKHEGKPFEDWFVDAEQVDQSLWNKYICVNKEYKEIVDISEVESQNGYKINVFSES